MAEVRDRPADLHEHVQDAAHRRTSGDEQVRDLLKSLTRDRTRAAELSHVDVKALEASTRELLARVLVRELQGQIPAQVAQQLAAGKIGLELLDQLTQRLANAASPHLHHRLGRAGTPEGARKAATDPSVPQQALRWTRFVQRAQHVPGARVRERKETSGPSLRSPRLVERAVSDLSPKERALLMRAAFGQRLSSELLKLGIGDPLQLVRAGALPQGRAELSHALGMPRAKLLALVLRSELLKVGIGRNGEPGITPRLLGPLHKAGIAMLGTLATLRSLTPAQFEHIYQVLRAATSGFHWSLLGRKAVDKRDLEHWAKTAARRPSEILLAGADERQSPIERDTAQELVQAWYLENLLWQQLSDARQQAERENEARRRERIDAEERDRERREHADGDDANDEKREDDDDLPELEYDSRTDELVCFWITDYNTDPASPTAARRMYVCVDPRSGAIIPQLVEAELRPGR